MNLTEITTVRNRAEVVQEVCNQLLQLHNDHKNISDKNHAFYDLLNTEERKEYLGKIQIRIDAYELKLSELLKRLNYDKNSITASELDTPRKGHA